MVQDHVHMLIAIPPKYSIAEVIGYIKGKSAIAVARQFGGRKRNFNDFDETCRKLLAIKGIGAWTVEYIAMRALRNPNAFPEADLELQKKIVPLKLDPKKWSPWRAYAAILLWNI